LLAILVIALAAGSTASSQVDFDLPSAEGFRLAIKNTARTDHAVAPAPATPDWTRAQAPAATRD
jgi:hypothetical protein